ncbi:ABC transporter G family member 33 [Carex littledalei]|uniref:ABC transporter G family member 33 n=1 Tax=Carex littledalei TaxID=544730 RepID=A0A833VY79_9POAL|nr:ABC transporter G family member 33 [Carex littledalei]
MESSIGEGEAEGKGNKQGWVPVDVGLLGAVERRHFIDSLINHIEEDNLRLLQKQRSRIDRYALCFFEASISWITVGFQVLFFSAKLVSVHVHKRESV